MKNHKAHADSDIDDEVVTFNINGYTYYMPLDDAVVVMRAFARAEYRSYELTQKQNSDYTHVARPLKVGECNIGNASLTQLMQERLAWEELQTKRLAAEQQTT